MLQRNRVKRDYQATLDYLRKRYCKLCPDLSAYTVPQGKLEAAWHTWCRGGYAETVGVLVGLLFAVIVALILTPPLPVRVAILAAAVSGAALAAVMVFFAARRPRKQVGPSAYFRAGVGAVVCDPKGLVLVLERADVPGEWQFPQGGIENGEEPLDAIYRELEEETGLTEAVLCKLGRFPTVVGYDLPSENRSIKTGMGQAQFWFFFRSPTVEPHLVLQAAEAKAWRWNRFDDVVGHAAPFRRPLYQALYGYFNTNVQTPPAEGSG
jgi:putative (di)nucleoside polyphosphate hydrolase